MESFNKLKL